MAVILNLQHEKLLQGISNDHYLCFEPVFDIDDGMDMVKRIRKTLSKCASLDYQIDTLGPS